MINFSLKGEYLFVLNKGTANEVSSGWMPNLITDAGLDRLGSATPVNTMTWFSIGTGTTTPTNSDTALASFTAATNNKTNFTETFSGSGGGYASVLTREFTYAQGAVVGNMAEVGIGWNSGGSGLFSRARIVDGAGVPTTLTVTSIDQLTVYYRLTITPTRTDVTGSTVIDSVTYNWTSRFANIASTFFNPNLDYMFNNSPAWMDIQFLRSYGSASSIGADTSAPSGSATSGSVTTVVATYTTGNYYNDCQITFAPADHNPSGGIKCLIIAWGNCGSQQQIDFGAAIPKDNTKTLTLTFRYSWSR